MIVGYMGQYLRRKFCSVLVWKMQFYCYLILNHTQISTNDEVYSVPVG